MDIKAQRHFLRFSFPIVPLCLALGGCKHEPPVLATTPPPVVMVSHPVEWEITDYYEYTGRTAAVDAVKVRARVSGYLVKVNFQEGSVVKKGDLLFQIDPRPFQAVLDEAKGQVAQWEAKLARAEANVPYEQLCEMEEINPYFPETDIVIVVGANDVTNPAAKNNKSSPLYGMPILEVSRARSIIVLKRSMRPDFAGVDNDLYYDEKCMMLFRDAKDSLTKLIGEMKSLL